MDLTHIHEFVVLAETKSFAETAERLFSTQSTISKHLKQLEDELGVRLFDRTSRKVALNEYGNLFLPYAKTILNARYEYQTAFYNHQENLRMNLSIGSVPAMAQYKITDIIIRFKRENKKFSLDVIEAEPSELLSLIREGKCELAFIRETGEADEDLVKIPYYTDHLIALLPAAHPLAGHGTLPLKALAEEDFLFIKEKTYMHQLCENLCHQEGFHPHVVFSGHRLENIIDFVAKEMGVALLMKQQATHLSSDLVHISEITPTVTNQLNVVYLKNAQLSEVARHFIQCLNQ